MKTRLVSISLIVIGLLLPVLASVLRAFGIVPGWVFLVALFFGIILAIAGIYRLLGYRLRRDHEH